MDLDSKQTISPRASCSLPPYPPLPDCYTGHPLPSVLVPLCPPRWQGGMVERPRRPRHQDLSSPSIRLSLCSRLAMCAGMYPQRRGVFLWPPQTPHLAASLSFPLCPSALDSSLTPHSCSLKQKQPLVCPPPLCSIQLAALRVSRVACASFSGSSVLPGATWPGVPLSYQATWVTSVNLLRPPCCCLGPFPALLSIICVLNLRLPLCGGWSPALLWI